MGDREGRGEANHGDTRAAPMVDDTEMSTHDANETAAADEVAGAGSETVGGSTAADPGIMHAPSSGIGQVSTGSGGFAVLAGSGVGGAAALFPTDQEADDDALPVDNDIAPGQRGLATGQDQDKRDANDRDVADIERD